MSKDFDKLLADKISDSFSTAEFEFSEDHWNAFLVKEKPRFIGIGFLSANYLKIAAVFLVLFGSIFLFQNLPFNNQARVSTDQYSAIEQPEDRLNNNQTPQNPGDQQAEILPSVPEQQEEEEDVTQTNELISLVAEEDSSEIIEEYNSIQYIEAVEIAPLSLSENTETSLLDISRKDLEVGYRLIHYPYEFITNKSNPPNPSGIQVHFSTLTTYSNAETNPALSYSGGVNSEISLSQRIGLTGGLTLARHDFELSDNGVEITTESELNETGVQTAANLLTLDIPLNLRLYTSNRNTYVSAGLSSFMYLREEFVTSFTQVTELTIEENGEQTVFRTVEKTQNTRREAAFSTFDFAQTLNFSFGFNRRLSNTTGLIIEPYLKIPLSPLTSENEKFGSAGIQLRINFLR